MPLYRLRAALPYVLTFTGYLIVAQISSRLYLVDTFPSPLMPPGGVALAAVILAGVSVWPSIALAALVNSILSGSPLFIAAGAALGNTLQAGLSGLFLLYTGFNRRLSTVRDIFLLLSVALVFSMIVPTVSVTTYSLYNYFFSDTRETYWVAWWLGSALSLLVFTPFLTRWLRSARSYIAKPETVETFIAFAFLIACSTLIPRAVDQSIGDFALLTVWGVLLWITFRLKPRFMTLALFVTTVTSISAAYGMPHGPRQDVSNRIFSTQVIDLITAVVYLLVFSLEDLRRRAVLALRERALQLEVALEKINAEDRVKNEFIATLAHELRNPLATLLTSVELLEAGGAGDAATRQIWYTMYQKMRVIQRLLEDLLDITRITRKQLVLQVEPVDVRSIINLSIKSVTPQTEAQRQILNATEPKEPVMLMADPMRLEQIFINLLNNASKYTPEHGRLEIACRVEDGSAIVTVSDTGIGIPEHMLTQIFEPFVQVHDPDRKRGGIGIGLALTKSLVEMHGGTVRAQRRNGSGSVFTVSLPISRTAVVQKNRHANTAADKCSTPLRLLIIDDNVEAAESLQKLLTLRGHRVGVGFDGHDALQAMLTDAPQVIFLDIGLPDISGYDVAEQIHAMNPHPFLIALSGYGQESDRRKAQDAGFDFHLTKPAGLGDIERVLNNITVRMQKM